MRISSLFQHLDWSWFHLRDCLFQHFPRPRCLTRLTCFIGLLGAVMTPMDTGHVRSTCQADSCITWTCWKASICGFKKKPRILPYLAFKDWKFFGSRVWWKGKAEGKFHTAEAQSWRSCDPTLGISGHSAGARIRCNAFDVSQICFWRE